VTSNEACTLVVAMTRGLSLARREGAAYQLLAHAAIARLHEQHFEIVKLRERYRRALDESRNLRGLLMARDMEPAS